MSPPATDAHSSRRHRAKRSRSITSLQALNLFNSRFILDQSQRLAERLSGEAGPAAEQQVRRAFELAFNRQPEEDELGAAMQLIADHGLAAFCRGLLNANELMFMP